MRLYYIYYYVADTGDAVRTANKDNRCTTISIHNITYIYDGTYSLFYDVDNITIITTPI